MSFSFKDRQTTLESLAGHPPELLVIGAGVVGASVAAHAAHLGLKVLVIEKEDIAAGASGNSTGLAHAGLRYLAQGRLGYVFREGRERHRLQELAPHWVSPFNFVLPVYQNDPYKYWMVRMGTWIYDLLGWLDALWTRRPMIRRHRRLSVEDVKEKIPGIRSEGLQGGIEYYVDARLQDSRFTLGYVQQAAQNGARILTHCKVLRVAASIDGQPRVTAVDLLTGKTLDVSASLLINATGAWIDEVRHTTGMGGSVVQKSRGIHLIVDHVADSPLILSSSAKGKVFFVLPVDAERSLVGTTDTPVSLAADEVLPQPGDVMDLLRQLFHYFPSLMLGKSMPEAMEHYKQAHVRDITWGIRPLLAQEGPTLRASREHRLIKDLPHFWSLPGVKLTAGRAAGYEAAAAAWVHLRKGIPMPSVSWDSLPGGELWDRPRFIRDAQKNFKLGANSERLISYLITMYGTRYVEILQWAQREPSFSERLIEGEPWILAEVAYAAHEEMVLTLNDLLWRRTKWAHYRDLPPDVVALIARTLGRFLGWPPEELDRQRAEYQTELKKHRLS